MDRSSWSLPNLLDPSDSKINWGRHQLNRGTRMFQDMWVYNDLYCVVGRASLAFELLNLCTNSNWIRVEKVN